MMNIRTLSFTMSFMVTALLVRSNIVLANPPNDVKVRCSEGFTLSAQNGVAYCQKSETVNRHRKPHLTGDGSIMPLVGADVSSYSASCIAGFKLETSGGKAWCSQIAQVNDYKSATCDAGFQYVKDSEFTAFLVPPAVASVAAPGGDVCWRSNSPKGNPNSYQQVKCANSYSHEKRGGRNDMCKKPVEEVRWYRPDSSSSHESIVVNPTTTQKNTLKVKCKSGWALSPSVNDGYSCQKNETIQQYSKPQ